MATIVTIGGDSNVVVVSPQGYNNDNEPELVHESLHFCLDGTSQNQRQQQQQQQQQRNQFPTASNTPPPPSNPSPHHPDFEEQQQHRVQVVMRKGMSTSSDRESSGKTESTADTTQSSGSNYSPGGTNSSLSTQLASPVATLTKNALGQTQYVMLTDSPLNDLQVPDRASSNISLQDMYDEDYDGNNNCAENRRRSDSNQHIDKGHYDDEDHGNDDDEEADFYADPEGLLIAPLTKGPPSEMAESGVCPPPNLMNLNSTLGTPPSTLYAPPPAAEPDAPAAAAVYHPVPGTSETTLQQQQGPQPHRNTPRGLLSADSMSSEVSNPTGGGGLSVSPAGPAFPMDGQTPPTRPMLYSAIGSLEICSAHSLKNMWHKQKQPHNNGFCQYDSSNLIAPQQHRQRNQRQHSAGDATALLTSGAGDATTLTQQRAQSDRLGGAAVASSSVTSTPDKFGDYASKHSITPSPPPPPPPQNYEQPTPVTAHHQSAFDASFRSIQEKLDAKQRKKRLPSRPSTASSTSTSHHSHATAATSSASTAVASNTSAAKQPVASSMRKSRTNRDGTVKQSKSVKIDDASLQRKQGRSTKSGSATSCRKSRKPIEMFRPSCDAYTPRMERKKITYKPAEMRTPVQKMATTMGTLSRPNFRDALRRVAMLIRQHIVKIEQRFNSATASARHRADEGLFKMSMRDAFSEEKFATCRYKCTVVRVPMARPGMVFGLKKIRPKYEIPTEEEIYEFAHQLFKTVQLSSECSIVCLIYIERLMEISKVPLLASTWRPIFLCGLLLASKVWQDLSSWNIEFASVYPQFSLDAINKLELEFLRMVKWDLYISSSLYAKYYFALRSLVEKPDFRQRYNRMVGGVDSVAASEALKIQKRTEQVKEEALMQLSRSM